MPEPLHPPYNITQPRQLVRWLDVNSQNGKLTRSYFNLTIPSFNPGILPASTTRKAWIQFAYDYVNAPNNFSIIGLTPVTATLFWLMISFTNPNNSVNRYLLLPSTSLLAQDQLPFDVVNYTNQRIKKTFRIEFWANTTQNVNTPTYTLLSTVRQNLDYRYSFDAPLVNPNALITNFSTPNMNLPFVLPTPPTLNTY